MSLFRKKTEQFDWKLSTIQMLEALEARYKKKCDTQDEYNYLLYNGGVRENVQSYENGELKEVENRPGRLALVQDCLESVRQAQTREEYTQALATLRTENENLTNYVNGITLGQRWSDNDRYESGISTFRKHTYDFGEIDKKVAKQLHLTDHIKESTLKILENYKKAKFPPGGDIHLFEARQKLVSKYIDTIKEAKTYEDVISQVKKLQAANKELTVKHKNSTTGQISSEGRLDKALTKHIEKLKNEQKKEAKAEGSLRLKVFK